MNARDYIPDMDRDQLEKHAINQADEIGGLKSAINAIRNAHTWQPIETAPKGEHVLCRWHDAHGNQVIAVCRYATVEEMERHNQPAEYAGWRMILDNKMLRAYPKQWTMTPEERE